MNTKIFLIAGTEDGRKLAEFLSGKSFDVTASVVSDYGRKLLETCAGVKINDKPLDRDELEKILREEKFNFLVDASHPYAKNISANAIAAAQAAKIFYVRYERAEIIFDYEKIFRVESYEAAALKASQLGKNIYLTTGSRSLKIFVDLLKDCNLTARVLPTAEVKSVRKFWLVAETNRRHARPLLDRTQRRTFQTRKSRSRRHEKQRANRRRGHET